MDAVQAARRVAAGDALPALTRVEGSMDLSFRAGKCELPLGLRVSGDLDLGGCGGLRSLPANLHVEGSLNLFGCTGMQTLAGGDHIVPPHEDGGGGEPRERDQVMAAAQAAEVEVASLAPGVVVGKDLVLERCTRLTALPMGLQVGGNLDLKWCTGLSTLPPGLLVGGDLDLSGCTALVALPPALEVGGSLVLSGCTGLRQLPDGLRVGRSLRLRGCKRLRSLPSDLSVGEDLDLEACSGLTSLPASLLRWPASSHGRAHQVYLGGAGITRETLRWLRDADAPGLRFHVHLRQHEEELGDEEGPPEFASLADAVQFWARESGAASAPQVAPLEAAQGATLCRFLSRLRDAKEFGIDETRGALANRIMHVLDVLGEDVATRDELVQRMEDSLDACGDKPVWALNQMSVVAEVARARGDREALEALGRRVMRLMVVHEHVQKKIRSLKWVDDVCVYLRFEIELREALDLPVQATSMIFRSYIKVADDELQAAKDDALAITEDQFQAWLEAWPEWQRQGRQEVADGIVWGELPLEPPRRRSLLRRSLRNLVGEKMEDPVRLGGRGPAWSLAELLRHWVPTGADLTNTAIRAEDLPGRLKRVNHR